jgi:alanine racemase
MLPVITPEESARLDAACDVPEDVLLERAGLRVAGAAVRMGAGYGARVIVLAGPGNNGGDGWVAARLLHRRGADVTVRSLGYPRGDGSPRRRAAIAAVRDGVTVRSLGEPEHCDLLIDGLFGAGFHGTLPEIVGPWAEVSTPTLAIDLPSGLDGATGVTAGPVLRADVTVTFQALKTGHLIGSGPDASGEVEVADIGLGDPNATWFLNRDQDVVLPVRSRDAHKWVAGAVVVVGGSPGITGAVMLAARSALEFGAGSAQALVPKAMADVAAAMDPGVMTVAIGGGDHLSSEDVASVLAAAERADVFVLGSGLGGESDGFVRDLLDHCDRPVVLDADALRSVTVGALRGRRAETVLTPHAGEFESLAGEAASPDAARRLADASGSTVLLKGSPTFVMGRDSWVVDDRCTDRARHASGGGSPGGRSPAREGGPRPGGHNYRDCYRAGGRDRKVGAVRPSWVEVDLAAITHNVAAIASAVAPAEVCAVVKADGYGHGDVPVAEAALRGGATRLAVALPSEGARLREAGVEGPILLLSEPVEDDVDEVARWELTPTVYHAEFLERLADALPAPMPVHVKVDTGMHRVGAAPELAAELASEVVARGLELEGVWTHFPVAESDPEFTRAQVAALRELIERLVAQGIEPTTVHAANTAAALAIPESRFDFVRIGLGTYGLLPAPDIGADLGLRPAMRLISRVTHVQRLPAGARPSYGRSRPLPADSTVATVPVGYADGLTRRLGAHGAGALIGGRIHPFAGTVTMDQVMIDVGDSDVAVGDEVVFLGRQDEAEITAYDWADRLDTITWEVVCGFGPRLPRKYTG